MMAGTVPNTYADLEVARLVARKAFTILWPDDDLRERGWDEMESRFFEFIDCGQVENCCQLDWLRCAVEQMQGEDEKGDYALAALKLTLSAFTLARDNPFFPSCLAGPRHHSDIDPLVGRALELMSMIREAPGFAATISWNQTAIDRLEKCQQHEWLGGLIRSAVRPG